MSLDIGEITKIVNDLEDLKRTEGIHESERDMLNRSLLPLKTFLLMQPPERTP